MRQITCHLTTNTHTRAPHPSRRGRPPRRTLVAPPRGAPGAYAGTVSRAAVETRSEGRPPDRATLRRSIAWDRSTLVSACGDVRGGGSLSRSPAAVWPPTRGPPCQRNERSRDCRRRRRATFVCARAKCQRAPSLPLATFENQAALAGGRRSARWLSPQGSRSAAHAGSRVALSGGRPGGGDAGAAAGPSARGKTTGRRRCWNPRTRIL